jgi:predicted dinucleotide-binding enzyme
MKIGIIGAGHIGATLAKQYRAAGHTVLIANSRGPETLQTVAADTGATPVTVSEATRGVDVVVISIPEPKILDLPTELFAGVPDDVVVIDTGNYYPGARDVTIEAIEAGMTESQWVAAQLGRPVIKAYNSIVAASLADKGRPKGEAGRIALPVAGDDARAKAIVMDLVETSGFDAIDAGPLAESWRQQPGTPAYCTDLGAEDLRQALADADRASAPKNRDLVIKQFIDGSAAGRDPVEVNRSLFAARPGTDGAR